MQPLVRAYRSVDAWGEDLLRYMRKRGYETGSTWAMLRRAFFECWSEPGFDRFWRVWNPVYGYGLLKLYLWLGGNKHPLLNRLLVFTVCGFVLHDALVLLLVGKFQLSTTSAFVFYGSVVFLSRRYKQSIRSAARPAALNALANLSLVMIGMGVGVALQHFVIDPVVREIF